MFYEIKIIIRRKKINHQTTHAVPAVSRHKQYLFIYLTLGKKQTNKRPRYALADG